MKTCPLCGSSYGDRVPFCFNDGTPLVDVPVTEPEPSTEEAATVPISPLDAPEPRFALGGLSDPFDAPEPRFAQQLAPEPEAAAEPDEEEEAPTEAAEPIDRPLIRPPAPRASFGAAAPRSSPPAPEAPPAPAPAAPPAAPPAPVAAPPAPAPAPAPPAAAPPPGAADTGEEPAQKSALVWIGSLAVAAIVLVLVGAWFASRPGPAPAPAAVTKVAPPKPAPVPKPAPKPAPAPPPAPEPPAPEPAAAPEPTPEPPPEPAPAPEPTPEPAPPAPKPAPAPKPRPTPPPPPPAEEAPATPWGATPEASSGVLSITSVPAGAAVFVDDRRVGQTPLTHSVAYGDHVLRVEKAGFHDEGRPVTVSSSAMTVPFELRAVVITGEVHIFGTPGHTVLVDGEEIGTIPATAKLSEGPHRFEAISPTGERTSTSRDIQFGGSSKAVTVTIGGG